MPLQFTYYLDSEKPRRGFIPNEYKSVNEAVYISVITDLISNIQPLLGVPGGFNGV